jgi:hypothetical protein
MRGVANTGLSIGRVFDAGTRDAETRVTRS